MSETINETTDSLEKKYLDSRDNRIELIRYSDSLFRQSYLDSIGKQIFTKLDRNQNSGKMNEIFMAYTVHDYPNEGVLLSVSVFYNVSNIYYSYNGREVYPRYFISSSSGKIEKDEYDGQVSRLLKIRDCYNTLNELDWNGLVVTTLLFEMNDTVRCSISSYQEGRILECD